MRYAIVYMVGEPALTNNIGVAEDAARDPETIVIDTELEVLMTPEGNTEIRKFY